MRLDTIKRFFTIFNGKATKSFVAGRERFKRNARCRRGRPVFRKKGIFLVTLVTSSLLLLGGANASMCIIPSEEGNWENYDSLTRGITRLEFRMECRDASTTTCYGSICSTTSAVKAHYFIRLFGSCYPTDCNWGEVEGERLSGSLEGWYRFIYNQGYATRYVYARTYTQWPGWLRLWIHTDFTDPNRADYQMDDWFRQP